MSNALLNACWPLKMPPTQKAVLIALADRANDSGECWLSIPSICERTCFSERAVHRAISELEAAGYLSADRSNGRSTTYLVTPANAAQPPQMRHPRRSGTTADESYEPPQMRQQPPQMRRKPPQQVRSIPIDPLSTRAKASKEKAPAYAIARPEGVAERTWMDWMALRKAKKAPVTETVLNHATAEAEKAGMPLDQFLGIWCARGSQGLQADWLKPNERAGSAAAKPSAAASFHGKTYTGTPIDDIPESLRPTA